MEVSPIDDDMVKVTLPNPDYYSGDLSETEGISKTVNVEMPNFDKFKVTTMTQTVILSSEVNKAAIFCLIRSVNPQEYKSEWDPHPDNFLKKNGKNKKIQLPYFEEEVGNIVAAGFEFPKIGKYFRGLRCTGGAFKNAVTMDIVTSVKNINLKLSTSKIQMCGSTSDEMVIEAIDYLIILINEVCDFVEYMRSKPQKSLKTIGVLRLQSKGPVETIFKPNLNSGGHGDIIMTRFESINIPTGPWNQIDPKIYAILGPKIAEAKFHGYQYCYIEHIFDIVENLINNPDIKVTEKSLTYKEVARSMVNYNYGLGFYVLNFRLQRNLSNLFNSCDFYKGCISTYQNDSTRRVKISAPFDVPEEYVNKIWRNAKTKKEHTFTITTKGPVTQSGPHEDLMAEIYYKVIGAIISLRPKVEDLVSEDVKRKKIREMIQAADHDDMVEFERNHPRDFKSWLTDRSRSRSVDYSDIRASLKRWLRNNRKGKLLKELYEDPN